MIAVNAQGLLYTTHAALPHLLKVAEEDPRRVADIVNISSIAGRVAWNGDGVYSLTKFGVIASPSPDARKSPSGTCASESWNQVAWTPNGLAQQA